MILSKYNTQFMNNQFRFYWTLLFVSLFANALTSKGKGGIGSGGGGGISSSGTSKGGSSRTSGGNQKNTAIYNLCNKHCKLRRCSKEQAIKEQLLCGYDRTSRPVVNDSSVTTVHIALSLFHILDTVSVNCLTFGS